MPNWLVNGDVLENYLQACKEAKIEDFKNDWRFRPIFEHCPKYIALNHIENVRRLAPNFLSIKWTNDTIGGAYLQELNGWHGSTSTAQYISVLANLVELFGTLEGLDILEIGGGYGGQIMCILDIFCPKSYTILDLPEVNELQRKVIQKSGVMNDITDIYAVSTIPKKKYDLVISNYALSEIPNQEPYQKLLKRCKHGYITCNTEIVNLDWAHKMKDIDGERPTNYILTW